MREWELDRHVRTAVRAIETKEPYEMNLVCGLQAVVGAEEVALNRLPEQRQWLAQAGSLPAWEEEQWVRRRNEHPYFRHLATLRASDTCRTTDLAPFRKYSQTSIFQDLLLPRDSRYQVAATLRCRPASVVFISIHRKLHDFTDGEVAALDRIRVPLGTAMAGRELLDRSLAWAGTSAEPPAPRLTPRQREVVALVAQGLTNCQIGVRLGISESAVRAHLGKALRLTGRPDRASVAVWWCQSGHDDAG